MPVKGQRAQTDEATSEQVRLLGRLATMVNTAPQRMSQTVLTALPEWGRYEKARIIPEGSSQLLREFHTLGTSDRGAQMAQDPNLVRILFSALEITDSVAPVQYVLASMYEVVRADTSRYDAIVEALRKQNFYDPMIQVIERQKSDTYTADKAAFLLSGIMCWCHPDMITDLQITCFVSNIIQGRYTMTEAYRLGSLSNILKLDRYRSLVWECPGAAAMISKSMDPNQTVPICYAAVFCGWLLTFNKTFLQSLIDQNLVKLMCEVLKKCRTEKIVRVCVHFIINILWDENALEIIMEEGIVQVLTVLEYEKWRDAEMYEEIRDGLHLLSNQIKKFSNFARYSLELDKRKLKWSFLHSEKFWHENVMQFEYNEFEAVKKLAALLKSSDSVTVCVACHDLGEFARLHPAGKKFVSDFK